MKHASPVLTLAGLALAAPILTAAVGAAPDPVLNGPPVLCSGIGEGAEADARAFPHSLRLVYADPDGHYLGEIRTSVAVRGSPVFSITCPGPWVLAELPPGTYRVTARFAGQVETRTVPVDAGAAPVEAVITFPAARGNAG